jgi:hypothetical protein
VVALERGDRVVWPVDALAWLQWPGRALAVTARKCAGPWCIHHDAGEAGAGSALPIAGGVGNAAGIAALLQPEVGSTVPADRDKENKLMEQGSLERQPQTDARRSPPALAAHGHPAAAGAAAGAGTPPQGLEADVQAHLGRQLRAVYDEMASQPVPDRLIQLLDALERTSVKPAAPPPGQGVPAASLGVPAASLGVTQKAGDV